MLPFESFSTVSTLEFPIEEHDDESEEKDVTTFCRTIRDLMGSKEDFGNIGVTPESSIFSDKIVNKYNIEEKLCEHQFSLFRKPTFIQDRKTERKRAQGEEERLRLQQLALEEEIKAKEAENRASAFQFDFGYLDAEVHDLLKALDSVYPDINPMPNTSTTKSIYASTKSNVEKLNLKVILNRLCIIGSYNISTLPETASAVNESENDSYFYNDVKNKFIKEMTTIRSRADSVFAKELGEITGCLLTYLKYFVIMFEGPELSLMDMMHQAKSTFEECVFQGSVLFVAGHVMVRYLSDWTDLEMNPPESTRAYTSDGNVDVAKENLVILSDTCQRLWRIVASAKSAGLDPRKNIVYDMLPNEELIKHSIDCHLLRPLDVWLRRVTQLTFGDFTSETWPQFFYPWVHWGYKSDTQFDSLGVLDTFGDMPGLDEALEEFIKTKASWKAKENIDNLEDVTRTLREKLIKQGDIKSMLSNISKITAY